MIDKLSAAVIALCSTSTTCPWTFEQPLYARVLVLAVHDAAQEHGVRADEMIALAWEESRFRPDARSPRGAVGMLQVMRRFWWYPWCTGKTYRCLRMQSGAGAKAFAHYQRKCRTLPRAIRGYRSGRCGNPVKQTHKVLKTLRRVRVWTGTRS